MHWILILIMTTGYGGGQSVATTKATFYNEAACNSALYKVQGAGSNAAVSGVCVEDN